jgi:hypothetical protein
MSLYVGFICLFVAILIFIFFLNVFSVLCQLLCLGWSYCTVINHKEKNSLLLRLQLTLEVLFVVQLLFLSLLPQFVTFISVLTQSFNTLRSPSPDSFIVQTQRFQPFCRSYTKFLYIHLRNRLMRSISYLQSKSHAFRQSFSLHIAIFTPFPLSL